MDMPIGPNVLGEVARERMLQDQKWGEQNHHQHTWLVILGEEFGEASKASLENDVRGMRAELIQVAAVAIAAVESIDRNEI